MTLLFDDQSDQPGAHLLVIGVGAYPHLPDGTVADFPEHEGMGQLTSTPISAQKVAEWFLGVYRNDEKPLRSVEVVVSATRPLKLRAPTGRRRTIAPATFQNVSEAIRNWKVRGDRNADNLQFMFYSGHGLARGLQLTLAMEDFGSDRGQPLRHAVDFTGLYLGLDQCAARNQVFFIDACRKASGALLNPSGFSGDPVFYAAENIGQRRAPIFYATIPGATAFGPPNKPTYFTAALLEALRGAGADDLDDPGTWQVNTSVLSNGIHFLLKRALGPSKDGRQYCTVDHQIRMPIHRLDSPPMVPVDVSCRSSVDTPFAVFAYERGVVGERRDPPAPTDWPLLLETGDYVFTASMQAPRSGTGSVATPVAPPYRPVRIGIQ
jgi:hypothetical protein